MPNPVEGIDQSNAPYVIVSSDTHAGLYVEDYRPYLESSVHAEFDEWLTTRHQHRAMVEELNGEYVEQWERDNEVGLKGAFDPAIRDKTLDADGVAGEVIFADGDSVTGMEAPPVRCRAPGRHDHRPPTGVGRSASAQPLARGVLRHEPAPTRRRRTRAHHPRDRRGGSSRSRRSPASPGSRAS